MSTLIYIIAYVAFVTSFIIGNLADPDFQASFTMIIQLIIISIFLPLQIFINHKGGS